MALGCDPLLFVDYVDTGNYDYLYLNLLLLLLPTPATRTSHYTFDYDLRPLALSTGTTDLFRRHHGG